MLRITDSLWIGTSEDERNNAMNGEGWAQVGSVLNVAHDLRAWCGWPEVEYAQVGLIDGPGNSVAAYCGAVLALAALQRRHSTLVCCHTGSRSVAVAVMYLEAISHCGWDRWLSILRERVDTDIPVPHKAHCDAFYKMNWRALSNMIGDVR